jgi:hypothetical protein
MFIELVDLLRCIHAHEESWLVASVDDMVGRDIVAGTLGCPVCRAEYPIRAGVADFGGWASPSVGAGAVDPERAMRLAAALDLTDPRAVAVLHGDYAALAPLIRSFAPTRLLLVNPAVAVGPLPELSVLIGARVALAPNGVRGLALDATADAPTIAALLRAVAPGGRVAGPAALPIPNGVRELARDEELWVAEREGAPMLELHRGPRRAQ